MPDNPERSQGYGLFVNNPRGVFLKILFYGTVALETLGLVQACSPVSETLPNETPTENPTNTPLPLKCTIAHNSMSAERFTQSASAFSVTNPRAGMIPVGGFVVSGEMNGESVTEEFVVVARDMNNLALARVTKVEGTDVFTRLEFGDATLEDGSVVPVFGIQSTNGTIEPILSINSMDAKGLLFRNSKNCGFTVGDDAGSGAKNAMVVNHEYIPMLTGSSEFVTKYKPDLKWGLRQVVDKDNNIITQIWDERSGNELALWDGEKWADGWQAKVPKESLEEGSEMWKKMELFGLTSVSAVPEVSSVYEKNIIKRIGKNFFLERVENVSFEVDGVPGRGIVLYAIGRNSDDSLSRIPLSGAVDVKNSNIGFGLPIIVNSPQYDKMFPRLPDGRKDLEHPPTFSQILEYYNSLVGHRILVGIPIWDTRDGDNPFSSQSMADAIFPDYGSGYAPGESPFEPDNALRRFVQADCSDSDGCYQAMVNDSTSDYAESKNLSHLANYSGYGLLLKSFAE